MKDILLEYMLYLQTLKNVEEFGNKYGDEKTLEILEKDLFEEPQQKKLKINRKVIYDGTRKNNSNSKFYYISIYT